jgi:hypothetical protein
LKIPKGGNQNPYIEEEQTTQWPKLKVQKDKERSTKHTFNIYQLKNMQSLSGESKDYKIGFLLLLH